jgi:hypothetical protein
LALGRGTPKGGSYASQEENERIEWSSRKTCFNEKAEAIGQKRER